MTKIKINIALDDEFQSFLNAQKPKTRSTYAGYFRLWAKFSGMNGKESIEFKRNDKDAETEKKVLAFQRWMIEQGQSENSAKTACGAISGFYTNKRMTLVFTRPERKHLTEASRSTEDYLFTKEDLAKMSEQAQMFPDKYVVLVGKSVGLRPGDFLLFTFGKFRGLQLDEAPVCIGETRTGKEKVKAWPFLDSDSVPIIKAILDAHKDAKDSDQILPFKDENTLTQVCQRLFEKAGLVSGGRTVRFHNLRKYLIDRLSAVASESQWKQIVGKKIAEGAYVSTDQLQDVYLRAMPSIVINGNNKNHAKIEELETKFADMNRLLGDQTMIIESLKQKDLERTKEIEAVKAQLDTLTHEELKKGVRALRERKRKKAKT
jgi:hypothetical protein